MISRLIFVTCLCLLPVSLFAQTTQAIDLPIQKFSWSAEWVQGGTGTAVPNHYDFVCSKTGVTTPIRKPLALAPLDVDFTTLFTTTDLGIYSCWAEAMTSTNTLIVKSTNMIGFELFLFQPPAPAPSEMRMRLRVR